ncbi:hypothetical protein PV08_02091 [Exophiala spinifera]|uniref:AMP-dependent synthetase/ligase domain-containing protein n=1 Tax=Exophiala spinifera TaxID=91928 RepID=A0A0D1Z1K6_9EURO|nr:uncharacterized protein PV08_02091 [Exophiala spinifera]KIW21511.1 hypothetical protein PV08_02091 [Exophiala spinifera]
MADYFRRLASHATRNHLAIVDPVSPETSTSIHHSYAQLLLRVTIFSERLITAAQETQRHLEGARVGLMVPPGLDFVASLLAIWSVKAIEITHTVTDSRQEFIIYHAEYKTKISPLLQGRCCIDVTTIMPEARPKKVVVPQSQRHQLSPYYIAN